MARKVHLKWQLKLSVWSNILGVFLPRFRIYFFSITHILIIIMLVSLLIVGDCHALSLMVQQWGLAKEPVRLVQWYIIQAGLCDQLPCLLFDYLRKGYLKTLSGPFYHTPSLTTHWWWKSSIWNTLHITHFASPSSSRHHRENHL